MTRRRTTTKTDEVFGDVSEKEWQSQLRDLLQLTGWKAYHTYDSRRSDPGFPDIVALHPATGDMFVVELKRQKGSATPAQLQWLTWFELADVDAYVWRPSDIDVAIARCQHPKPRAKYRGSLTEQPEPDGGTTT